MTDNTLKFSLPRNRFEALRACSTSNDVRYYLDGFCVDCIDPAPVAVATDGHRLIRVPIDAPESTDTIPGGQVIYQFPARKLLAKIATVEIDTGADTLTMLDRHAEIVEIVCLKRIDAQYPDWRRVLPDEPDWYSPPVSAAGAVRLNPDCLADVAAALDAYSMDIRFPEGNLDPVPIRFGNHSPSRKSDPKQDLSDIRYIVMPMRA